MTIETAYEAFAEAVAAALVTAGYVAAAEAVQIDPEDLIEPTGAETEVMTAATVERQQTGPVRQLLGTAVPRWIVERQCTVELLSYGPARDDRLAIDVAAVAALAALPVSQPTLAGTCERLTLIGVEDGKVPPNGVTMTFAFVLRVRSGDPMGATP